MRVERRVVITGIGLVTPLGIGATENWEALLSGHSGIGPISQFDAAPLPTRIAGEVRGFEPARFLEKRDIKRTDRFIQFALAAARLAIETSGLEITEESAPRIGVVIGVGMGGIESIEKYIGAYLESGLKHVTPFFVPRLIANMAAGQIAIQVGAKGPNYAVTSACASGTHAVGESFRLIRHGYQDAMLAGGAEAPVTPLGVGGFAVMKVLSTRNSEPQRASRPFDRGRDGFVVAEGAAVLVLEDAESARKRGARIYAEIVGYGATADAYHITAPPPDAAGAVRCMRETLQDAGIQPEEVGYINAHGTSTPQNDANETRAIKQVFGDHAFRLPVSSTKSQTGHLLGAAGGVEAAYTALALHCGVVPATRNYEERDPECDLDYVPNEPRQQPILVALSNSFGFGGTNACIAMRRWE